MTYNRELPSGEHIAGLKCDQCGRVLDTSQYMTNFLWLNVDDEPLAVHQWRLREIAQRNDWAYISVSNQTTHRDLCPDCFVLPPEG